MASQDDGEKEKQNSSKEDETYFCQVCSITFAAPKTYFAHIYSVSHLKRANVADVQAASCSSVTANLTATALGKTASPDQVQIGTLPPGVDVEQRGPSKLWPETGGVQAVEHSGQKMNIPTYSTIPGLKQQGNSSILGEFESKQHANSPSTAMDSFVQVGTSTEAAHSQTVTGTVSVVLPETRMPNATVGMPVTTRTDITIGSTSVTSVKPDKPVLPNATTGMPARNQVSMGADSEVADKQQPRVLPHPSTTGVSTVKVPLLSSSPSTTASKVPSLLNTTPHVSPSGTMMPKVPALLNMPPQVSSPGTMAPKVPALLNMSNALTPKLPLLSSPVGAPPKIPLLGDPSVPKIPLLVDPSVAAPKIPLRTGAANFHGSGFESQATGFPNAPLLDSGPKHGTNMAPVQRIPLLKSPPLISSSMPAFTFSASFSGTTVAPKTSSVGTHHAGPLLPTPSLPVRGPVRSLLELPLPATYSSRAPSNRTWDHPSPPPVDIDLQLHGIEVKEYNHGMQSKPFASSESDNRIPKFQSREGEVGSRGKSFLKACVESCVEPLVEGSWVLKPKVLDGHGRTFSCQICGIKFDDFLLYELHLAGLRHRKASRGLASKPSGAGATDSAGLQNPSDPVGDAKNPGSHSPVFVTGLLDPKSGADLSGLANSSTSSSGCFSELEQRLHSQHPDPVLGVDYVTEYRYLGGRLEYACDLCDLSLNSVSEVLEHLKSTDHLLQYMCYNDIDTYKTVADKPSDANGVREAAEKIAKRTGGGKSRARVKLESDELSSNGLSTWIELKDDTVLPISALPGHRLSGEYSKVRPRKPTISIDSIDSLLRTLALHSCLSAHRPVGLTRPLRRQDFIQALGEFEIKSGKDAEVCLQLANFLTMAVINFRRQMLPSLNAVNVSQIEQKLKSLHHSAEAVAKKTIAADPVDFDLTRPASSERSK